MFFSGIFGYERDKSEHGEMGRKLPRYVYYRKEVVFVGYVAWLFELEQEQNTVPRIVSPC